MADSNLDVTEMLTSHSKRYKQTTEGEISSICWDDRFAKYISDDEDGDGDLEINDKGDENNDDELGTVPATDETTRSYFTSKCGIKWSKVAPPKSCSVVDYTERNSGPLDDRDDPYMIFRRLISDDMVNIIIEETNWKATKVTNAWNSANPTNKKIWRTVTPKEFDAFMAIILHSGLHKLNNEPIWELWGQTDHPIYKASLPYERFMAIKRFIRFDNADTRRRRLNNSKTAAIDDVWQIFQANLAAAYIPHDSLTVYEQLFSYKGVARFTVDTPSEAPEYETKIRWVHDSKTFYPLKGIIYSGKREAKQEHQIIHQLVEKYVRTGRTIYADKFPSTLDVARELRRQNTAFVGTVCPDETFVPPEFCNSPERPVYSSLFGFYEDDVSLCSYVPKKNKATILLSTKHYTCDVDKTKKRKPISILDYNAHKSRMDTMDQMLNTYSCKRSTNRWPLAMFYNMLDVAALAAFVIFNENDKYFKADKRRVFMRLLTRSLAMDNLYERARNVRVMSYPGMHRAMDDLYIKAIRPFCEFCQRENGRQRKSRLYCFDCNQPICIEHTILFHRCNDCYMQIAMREGSI